MGLAASARQSVGGHSGAMTERGTVSNVVPQSKAPPRGSQAAAPLRSRPTPRNNQKRSTEAGAVKNSPSKQPVTNTRIWSPRHQRRDEVDAASSRSADIISQQVQPRPKARAAAASPQQQL